jgi:rfaE bifunctional protein nucleotidyltransferase chain/domain
MTRPMPEAWQQLLRQIQVWKMASDSIVFTNGCFDVLHPGHLHSLKQAKAQGDRLIVGVNSDASVARSKGPQRPLCPQEWRLTVVKALHWVDAAVLFDQDTPESLIHLVRPDVLVKGMDYAPEDVVGASFVTSYGGRLHQVALFEGYSTTSWLHHLLKKFNQNLR